MRVPQTLHALPALPDNGVYAIVAEVGDDDFVVKVGRTNNPFERYTGLLTGIPFDSVMLWMPVGHHRLACAIETEIHQEFSDRRTVGEWFRFRLAEKTLLHDAFRTRHERLRPSVQFKWTVITRDQALAAAQAQKERRAKYRRR